MPTCFCPALPCPRVHAPCSLPPCLPDPAHRSCEALQELRLNHNQLTSLPEELASNSRLKILDVGGNAIASFDDIQVGGVVGGGAW